MFLTLRRVLFGLLFGALAFAALAQQGAAPALPPAPTPTPLYPGAGTSAQYSDATGTPLYVRQSLYLPIYSHIYRGDADAETGRPAETLLSVQVSIRNTDPSVPLQIVGARYYDAKGTLLGNFLQQPETVPPLGAVRLNVSRPNASGTANASLVVDWSAERPINEPLVEALHIDTRASRNPLFITTARPIQSR